MKLKVSCAIRGCPHEATVESEEFNRSTDFVLCNDCETSVIIDCHLRIEQDTTLKKGWTHTFMVLYNGWFRRRKGVSLAHRSGVVKSLVDMQNKGRIIEVGS